MTCKELSLMFTERPVVTTTQHQFHAIFHFPGVLKRVRTSVVHITADLLEVDGWMEKHVKHDPEVDACAAVSQCLVCFTLHQLENMNTSSTTNMPYLWCMHSMHPAGNSMSLHLSTIDGPLVSTPGS